MNCEYVRYMDTVGLLRKRSLHVTVRTGEGVLEIVGLRKGKVGMETADTHLRRDIR